MGKNRGEEYNASSVQSVQYHSGNLSSYCVCKNFPHLVVSEGSLLTSFSLVKYLIWRANVGEICFIPFFYIFTILHSKIKQHSKFRRIGILMIHRLIALFLIQKMGCSKWYKPRTRTTVRNPTGRQNQ